MSTRTSESRPRGAASEKLAGDRVSASILPDAPAKSPAINPRPLRGLLIAVTPDLALAGATFAVVSSVLAVLGVAR